MPPIKLEGEYSQGSIKGTIPEERGVHPLKQGGEVEIISLRKRGRNGHGVVKAFEVKIPQLSVHPFRLKFNGSTEQTIQFPKGALKAKLVK